MAKRPPKSSDAYEIGYGKPPVETRFRPGQSGNPRGRPRKQLSVFDVIDKLLREKVPVKIGGDVKMMTRQNIALRAVSNRAMNGDLKAFQFLLDTRDRYEGRDDSIIAAGVLSDSDLALVQNYLARQGKDPQPEDGGGRDAE